MLWSQPKPWAKTIVAGPLPATVMLWRCWIVIVQVHAGQKERARIAYRLRAARDRIAVTQQ
jgi:hypothetical protein